MPSLPLCPPTLLRHCQYICSFSHAHSSCRPRCCLTGDLVRTLLQTGHIANKNPICIGDGALELIEDPAYMHSVPQRDAELLPLHIAAGRASSGTEAQQASAALQQALNARSFVDQAVRHAVSALLSLPEVTSLLQVS